MPGNQTLEATGPGGAVATWTDPTATDTVEGSRPVTCTPASGSTFGIGTTTVTCSASDTRGHSAGATFTITVQDTQPPTFSGVPGNQTLEATGPAGAVATWTDPMATDTVDGPRPVTCAPVSGSTFAIGTTTVTCSASDTSGHSASATFTITVQDTTPPDTTITASPANPSNSASATFEFTSSESGGTFQCSLDAAAFAGCASPTTYSSLADDSHTFQVRATDAAGNTDSTPASYTWTVTANTVRSIYILNSTLCGAITMSGNAVIDVGGIVAVNSNCSSALSASGNAHVEGSSIQVVGGWQTTGNASFNPTPTHPPDTTGDGSPDPVADPLGELVAPSANGLMSRSAVNCSGNNSLALQPGIYPSLKASGNCTLTLSEGTYVLKGGGFSVSGNAGVSVAAGNRVFIYNAGSNYPNAGGTFGAINLSGNGAFNLTPPTSGAYAGTLIFQARDNTKAASLSGNATLGGLKGTVYAPVAQFTLSGNGTLQTTLIVNSLRLSGNAVSSLTAGNGELSDADAQAINAVGQLRSGVLLVSIQDPSGTMPPSQLERIREGIARINDTLGPYGVSLVEVDAASADSADLRIAVDTASPCGDLADGILGCSTVYGDITLISGWDWYAGADVSAIGSSQFDLQTIVTHEVGHSVGVEHSSDTNSTMYYALSRGTARRNFTQTDLDQPTQATDSEEHQSLMSALRVNSNGEIVRAGNGHEAELEANGIPSLMISSTADAAASRSRLGSGLFGGRFDDSAAPLDVRDDLRTPVRVADPYQRGFGSHHEEILVGGDGDDLLIGGPGRDLLLGGYARHESADSIHDVLGERAVRQSHAYDLGLDSLFEEWDTPMSLRERLWQYADQAMDTTIVSESAALHDDALDAMFHTTVLE